MKWTSSSASWSDQEADSATVLRCTSKSSAPREAKILGERERRSWCLRCFYIEKSIGLGVKVARDVFSDEVFELLTLARSDLPLFSLKSQIVWHSKTIREKWKQRGDKIPMHREKRESPLRWMRWTWWLSGRSKARREHRRLNALLLSLNKRMMKHFGRSLIRTPFEIASAKSLYPGTNRSVKGKSRRKIE